MTGKIKQKTKQNPTGYTITIWPSNLTPKFLLKINENLGSYTYVYVYGGSIHNQLKL